MGTTTTLTLAMIAGTSGVLGEPPDVVPGGGLATAQSPGGSAAGDFTGDGLLDANDFFFYLALFAQGCP